MSAAQDPGESASPELVGKVRRAVARWAARIINPGGPNLLLNYKTRKHGALPEEYLCNALEVMPHAGSFILIAQPFPGDRVRSPLRLSGCSRTYECNVIWTLIGQDGAELSSGATSGGGVEAAGRFEDEIPFEVRHTQIAQLRLVEEDASDGEGFPPATMVIPLVLDPPQGPGGR